MESTNQKKEKFQSRDLALGVQHLFAMFGATVVVPLITGMNPSLALFTAGLGTLIFHLCTKFKVPVFLGSSFAFIPAIISVTHGGASTPETVALAQGGLISAGAIYLLFSLLAYAIGPDNIKKIFPPIVTGSVIVLIGLSLVDVAVRDCTRSAPDLTAGIQMNSAVGLSLGISLFTVAVVLICMMFFKGFFKLIPILIGIAAGYLLCYILDVTGVTMHFFNTKLIDFAKFAHADWFNIPFYSKDTRGIPFMQLPKFDWTAIITIAPLAVVTVMEHIGDITTNGAVVGKDFFKDPGLHRTLLGDGLAHSVAGFFGGPACTTYAENTGVLATTKVYKPAILRIAACFAILLAIVGKFGAALQTIPGPVMGGVELILYGMIAAIGIRTLSEAKIDFTHSRNLLIVGLILSVGGGLDIVGGIFIKAGTASFHISGLFAAVVVGLILNLVLPKIKEEKEAE